MLTRDFLLSLTSLLDAGRSLGKAASCPEAPFSSCQQLSGFPVGMTGTCSAVEEVAL
jgi:hypothetical protein